MNFMIKLSKNKLYSFFKTIPGSIVIITLALISAVTLNSCRNSPAVFGTEVLPDDLNMQVHYIIYNGVYGYSVTEDSVRSNDLPKNLIGSRFDSTFGVTTAGVAAQFVLSSNGADFGANPQLDSLILEINYSGDIYGDSTTVQTLHVYELNEDMILDTTYYSNYNFQMFDIDYANMPFTPKPHDSIIVNGDTLPPMIRINLSKTYPDLAEKILNADTSDLQDGDAFVKFFKGLYITTDPVTNGGALIPIDLISRGSRLALYYSNDENDSLVYNFFVAALASPRVNTYKHDYTLAAEDFKQQVLNGDTALGEQKFYVQGLAGTKAIIKIPDLRDNDSLDYEHIAINEVKLILPGAVKSKYPPEQLALVRRLADGSYEPLPDEYLNHELGDLYFGGKYLEGGNEYIFRLTKYVQKLISDENYLNNGLYLFVSGASYKPEEFIFKGNLSGDALSGMRIEIIYTVVN